MGRNGERTGMDGRRRFCSTLGLSSTVAMHASPAVPMRCTVWTSSSFDRLSVWYCMRGERPTSPSTSTPTFIVADIEVTVAEFLSQIECALGKLVEAL